MKLTTGKMSNKDLAEWFGITPNSLSKKKTQKLEELKKFALYHMDHTGKKVIIDKVLTPEYCKVDNYAQVVDKIDETWSENGLDSCTRVGNKIYDRLIEEDEQFSLKPNTVIEYTRQGRNELYGMPFDENSKGKIGSCTYTWCKRNDDTGEYEMLTKEEQTIKANLQKKYFGDATEKQILVKAMVEAGEIKREEAWSVLEEITNMQTGNFMAFLIELQDKIGCRVVRGTLVQRDKDLICAWEDRQ